MIVSLRACGVVPVFTLRVQAPALMPHLACSRVHMAALCGRRASRKGEIRSRDLDSQIDMPPGDPPCHSFGCQVCLLKEFSAFAAPAQRSP